MRSIERRLEQLEEQAQQDSAPEPVQVDAGTLAAGLVDTWQRLDDGTFAGSVYHRRAMTTMREALQMQAGLAR